MAVDWCNVACPPSAVALTEASENFDHGSAGWLAEESDRLDWDAYHEAVTLPYQVEQYKDRQGYYPESVYAVAA